VSNAFVAKVEENDLGDLVGCAVYGHSTSVVDGNNQEDDTVSLKGKHCLKNQSIIGGSSFGGELSHEQFASDFPYVQMQCYALSGTTWSVTESKLRWAVAGNCGVGNSQFTEAEVDLAPLADGLDVVALPSVPTQISETYDPNSEDYLLDFNKND
jgi:hypothetical protein